MQRPFAACIACVCFGLLGCSKPIDPTGKWTGKMILSEADKTKNPSAASQAAGMTFDLEVKADKTFKVSIGVPIEGTRTYVDKSLTLTATKMMGMDVPKDAASSNKPIVLKMADDGKSMTGTDSSGKSTSSMVFTRVSP